MSLDRGRVEEMLTNFILDNNAALTEANMNDVPAYDLVMNAITFISTKYGNGGVSVADVKAAKPANAAATIPDALDGLAEGMPVRDIEEIEYRDIKRGVQKYNGEVIFDEKPPQKLVLPTVVLTTNDGEPQIFYVPLTLNTATVFKLQGYPLPKKVFITEFLLSINLVEIEQYFATPIFNAYKNSVLIDLMATEGVTASDKGQFIEAILAKNMTYGELLEVAKILQIELDKNAEYYIVGSLGVGAIDMLEKAAATTTGGGAEFAVGDTFRTKDYTDTLYTIDGIDNDMVTVSWGVGVATKTASYSIREANGYFRDGLWEKVIKEGSLPPAAAVTKNAPPKTPTPNKTSAIKPEIFEIYVDRRGSKKGNTNYLQYSELVREKGTKMIKLHAMSATMSGDRKYQEVYVKELLEKGKIEKFIKLGDVFDTGNGIWEVTGLKALSFTMQPIRNGNPHTTGNRDVGLSLQTLVNIDNFWVRQKTNTNTGAGGDAQRQSLREQIEALEPLAADDGEVQIELDRLRLELAAIK